jgi:hypothetical protein
MRLHGSAEADIAREKAARDMRLKSSGALPLVARSFLGIEALALAVTFIALLEKIGG